MIRSFALAGLYCGQVVTGEAHDGQVAFAGHGNTINRWNSLGEVIFPKTEIKNEPKKPKSPKKKRCTYSTRCSGNGFNLPCSS